MAATLMVKMVLAASTASLDPSIELKDLPKTVAPSTSNVMSPKQRQISTASPDSANPSSLLTSLSVTVCMTCTGEREPCQMGQASNYGRQGTLPG